jgi:hypothetical protein
MMPTVDGRALTDQRERPSDDVGGGISLLGGQDARRNGNGDRDEQRRHRKFGGRREPLEREHERGLSVAERFSEVTSQRTRRERYELEDQRPIEAVQVTEGCQIARRRFGRHHDGSRIARQMQNDKHDRRDADQNVQCSDQAAKYVGQHRERLADVHILAEDGFVAASMPLEALCRRVHIFVLKEKEPGRFFFDDR